MKLLEIERCGVKQFLLSEKALWALMATETGKQFCVIHEGDGLEVNQGSALAVVPFDDLMSAKTWAQDTMPDNGDNWWVLLDNGVVVDECS